MYSICYCQYLTWLKLIMCEKGQRIRREVNVFMAVLEENSLL